MIDTTELTLKKLAKVVYNKDSFNMDRQLICCSKWKDEKGYNHEYFYNATEMNLDNLIYHCRKIHEEFSKSTADFSWDNIIETFENTYEIDLFTLISFVYMKEEVTPVDSSDIHILNVVISALLKGVLK